MSNPVDRMAPRVVTTDPQLRLWWRGLCVVAAANSLIWLLFWSIHAQTAGPYTIWHLYLSGVYVLVCAYRSAFPRVDLERLVVVDSGLSSIFLGRTAATIAEICFAVQLALFVHQLAGQAGLAEIQALAWMIPVFMTLAQLFCWHSVLTLRHITQAAESALWASGVGCMALLLAMIVRHAEAATLVWAVVGLLAAVAFVTYLVVFDIPLYLQRHRRDLAEGAPVLDVAEGVVDACRRRLPGRHWSDWRADAMWLTPYFSVCVWISIGLIFVSIE